MESQGQPCLKGLPSQPLGATTGQNDQDQENIPTSKKRVLEQTCLPQSKKQKNEGSVSTRVEKSNSIPRVLLDGDEDDETEEGDQLQRNLDETPEHFSESDDHPEELRNTTTTSLNQCETEGELVQHEDKPFNNDKTSCHEEECQREATSSVKVAVSSSYHGDISKEEDPINLLEEKTSTQNATESNPSSSTEQATICQDFQGHSTSDEVNIGLTYNNLSNKEVDANYQIQGHDHLDRDDRKNKVHMKLDMDNIQLLSVGGDYIDGLPSIVAVTSPNPDSVIGCHGDGVVQQADTGKGEAQNQSPAQSTIILNSSSNNQKSNDLDTMPIHVYPQGQGISLVTSSGILTADISTFSTQVPTILTEGDADENETHTNFSEQFHVVTTSNGLAGTPHIPGQTNEMLSVMMSSSDLSKSVILTADQQKAILDEVINPGVAGGQTLHITIPHVTTSGHQTIATTQGSEGNVPCGDQEGVDGQVRAIQVQLLSTNEVSMDKGTGEEGSGKNSSCHHQDCGKVCHRANKLKMHLVSQSGDRPYKCPHEGCEWAFATAYKLKRHERGHTGERPFVCPYEDCGRRFTTAYNLKTHVRAHNIPHIPCQYEGCDKSFPTLHKFRVHERRHQQEEKPFRCEVDGCGKEFSAMGTLASHLKSHSGERPHGCPMEGCDKRFTKASKLKLHLRTHTGERPFACDVEGCGWSFTSAYKLKRHMRKHTGERPFVCAYEGCHKSFTRSSHLKTHTLVHTGEKPYVCPIDGCNKAFTAGSSLNVHMRKHTGEKPFRCEEDGCTKAYTTASNLRAHQKRHDKNPKILEGSDDQQPLPSEYVTVNAMSGASNASSLVDNDSEVTYTGMHTFSSEDFTNDDVTTIPVSVHFPPGSLNAIVTNTGNPLTFSTAGTQDHSDVTDEQGKGTVATVTLPVSNMEVDGSHIDVAEFVVRSDNVEPVLQHHEVSKHSDVDTLKHDGGFDLSITSIVNQLRSHETSPTTKLGSNDVLATHRGERLVIDSKFVPSHSRALEFRTPVNPEDQFKPPAVIFQEDKSGSSDTEGEMSQVHSDLPTTNQGLMQITLPQEVIQIHFPPTNSPVPPVPSENETTIEMETTAGHHQLQAFESSSLSELQAHNLNKTQLSPYMEEESPDDSQVDNYPESTINLQDLR